MTAQKQWVKHWDYVGDEPKGDEYDKAHYVVVCLWSEHEKDCKDAYKEGRKDLLDDVKEAHKLLNERMHDAFDMFVDVDTKYHLSKHVASAFMMMQDKLFVETRDEEGKRLSKNYLFKGGRAVEKEK